MRHAVVITAIAAGLTLGCGDSLPGGQPGTIAGRIWAPSVEGDSVPLSGATVLVTETFCGFGALCAIAAQTTTDSLGHYLLTVPPDQYSAVVNAPPDMALQSASTSLSVSAGQAVTWSVTLQRTP